MARLSPLPLVALSLALVGSPSYAAPKRIFRRGRVVKPLTLAPLRVKPITARPLIAKPAVLRPARDQRSVALLERKVGARNARLLLKTLDSNTMARLLRGVRGMARKPQGETIFKNIGQALSALDSAQGRVETDVLRRAVKGQILSVGRVAAKLLSGQPIKQKQERVAGSERGAVVVSKLQVSGRHGDMLNVVSAPGMTKIHVVEGGVTRALRVGQAGVTKPLNAMGTKEITERVLPTGKIVWTHTSYTMVPGRDKPTRVRREKSFVDRHGRDVPFKLEGSAKTMVRLLVEDRRIP